MNKIDSKKRLTSQDDFARFALEDFGTVDVPIALRREARLLATRLGITPKQALDQLQSTTPARPPTKGDRHKTSSQGKPVAQQRERPSLLPPRGGRQRTSQPQTPRPAERRPIWLLRRDAVSNGRKWISTACTVCAEAVFIHVD
jgi:hypothetical protein